MAWLVQQKLPQAQLPIFDGAPLKWVEFITKFKDVVHDQDYLNDTQRCLYLTQHLSGPAKRAVQGFVNDRRGYVLSLQQLKYRFGQKSKIAQATLQSVTKGKSIENDDLSGLEEFYYQMSDCLVTLRMLRYSSDLYSSDILRQAVSRLPHRLTPKWAEYSFRIRSRSQEPNLVHLAEWLQERLLAMNDASLPEHSRTKKGSSAKFNSTVVTSALVSCRICEEKHPFYKCSRYKELPPGKRYDFLKKLKLCTNCCSDGHSYSNCTSQLTCFASGCNQKHHTSLHQYFEDKKSKRQGGDKNRQRKEKDANQEKGDKKGDKDGDREKDKKDEEKDVKKDPEVKKDPPDPKDVKTHHVSTEKDTYLWIVPVTLSAPDNDRSVSTYALLDNASTDTLLREDVAAELNLQPSKMEPVNVGTVLEEKKKPLNAPIVSLSVSARDGANNTPIKEALVVPSSSFNMPAQPRPPDPTQSDLFASLNGIPLSEVRPDEITILIGADAPTVHIPVDSKRGNQDELLAVNTLFGWTLFGKGTRQGLAVRNASFHHVSVTPTHASDKRMDDSLLPKFWVDRNIRKNVSVNSLNCACDNQLHTQLERFWLQEHSAILPHREPAMSQEDTSALAKLEAETKYLAERGRYMVPMLRRTTILPDSRYMALKRFHFTLKRLRKDPNLFQIYKNIIDGYVTAGYARKLSESEARAHSPRTWFLPHHPVVHPNKPGKVRVVFDGAAEVDGVSLNSTLITGPDLLNNLVGVLIRFRSGRIAIAADVEAYYHQVLVPPEDAESLRFFWTENIHDDKDICVMQMLVHIFGAKDSANCVIYALQRTARDNHEDFDALSYETILRSFYMDDCLKSVGSAEEMVDLASKLIALCKRGGFRLTKFLSNDQSVLDSLPPSEVSPRTSVDLDGEHVERALGVHWETTNDMITFSSNLKEAPPTKRGILRTASSLFDPLGFLTPYTIVSRLLLQDLWRSGCDWDDEVAEPYLSCWNKWLEGASHVSEIKLDRCYDKRDESVQEIQLHLFCDASEVAYGSAAYFRFTSKSGAHESTLVAAKSKLAPIKVITLPRLELNSAVTAVRLYRTVIMETDLPVERICFWTDSVLALQYITNCVHRPKAYVANRQNEILESSASSQWRHIPGKANPADLLTRGVPNPADLLKPTKDGTLWFRGPSFLQEDEDSWPRLSFESLSENDPELKKRTLLVALGFIEKRRIDPSRHSTWLHLVRTVAWILRYVSNSRSVPSLRLMDPSLTCTELHIAEVWVVKDAQTSTFQDDIQAIQTGKQLPRSSPLASLSPFLDTAGALCVGGRLKNADLFSRAKYQRILPKEHPVTTLLIRREHVKNGHVGPDHVLSNLRESYWILSGRSAIKATIRRCFFCQVRKAQRKYPMMADLPPGRVAHEEPPFTNTGVDLFGPISVKQGRKQVKRYGVIFTCLTVRCVHLDVVESADTDAFINCLRRFTNRRGRPRSMYSDRGSNFVGCTNELKEFISNLDHHKIKDFASAMSVDWVFNPPKAPHMGGAWERLVRSTKQVMSGLMNEKVLTDPQLYTLLTEVECILNNRPLTHVSDDADDFNALTPNHILFGKYRLWSYLDCDITDKDISSRKHYRQVQALAGLFWRRWRKEYLPDLTRRPIWRSKVSNVAVGELVLLNDDDDTKRRSWPLARVIRTLPARDGTVRIVELKTKDGVYTRPVSKIHRLEDHL